MEPLLTTAGANAGWYALFFVVVGAAITLATYAYIQFRRHR